MYVLPGAAETLKTLEGVQTGGINLVGIGPYDQRSTSLNKFRGNEESQNPGRAEHITSSKYSMGGNLKGMLMNTSRAPTAPQKCT